MDSESQKIFDEILLKDQDSLSQEEVAFLMARRSYLNDEQRKRYADLISAHEKAVKSGTIGMSADGLDAMGVPDLRALAEKEGVELKGARSKAALMAAIRAGRESK